MTNCGATTLTFYIRIKSYVRVVQNLGVKASIHYLFQKLQNKKHEPYALYSKYACHPLLCRPATSDLDVFSQIFMNREYRCLDDITDVDLIIDCGANVGFSAAYFLSRFPGAHIIAVEPDPGNFRMLQKNLEPYGDRACCICSAVWSRPVELAIKSGGDRREWARQVEQVGEGEEATITAKDIGTILQDSGFDRIGILKVDIEGAEADVFSYNYEHWISRVDNIVIELHNKNCISIFREAIAKEKFNVTECDELTVCRREIKA